MQSLAVIRRCRHLRQLDVAVRRRTGIDASHIESYVWRPAPIETGRVTLYDHGVVGDYVETIVACLRVGASFQQP